MKRSYGGQRPQSRGGKRGRSNGVRYGTARVVNFPQRQAPVIYTPSETKYFDVGINAAVTSAGTTWADTEVPADNYVNTSGAAAAYTDSALIPSANGNAYGEVIGNQYHIKKMRVRGVALPAAVADQADCTAAPISRIVLVHDQQPNGMQAQGEDVMQDTGVAAENQFSFKRVSAESSRYRILKDVTLVHKTSGANPDGANTTSQAWAPEFFSFQYVPKTPIQVSIKSGNSTPTVGGLVNANIFLLAYGTRGSGAVPVTIQAVSRCYYCE